jgi:murein DD-endopeptidase MepM/ murein hydrolase activator NlpD
MSNHIKFRVIILLCCANLCLFVYGQGYFDQRPVNDISRLPIGNGYIYHPKSDSNALCKRRLGVYIAATSDLLVRSFSNGKVVKISEEEPENSYLVAVNSNGTYYFYGLVSGVVVKPGQQVAKGQVIGDLKWQKGGRHLLLFSVYRNGSEINEEQLISRQQ